MNIDFTGKAAIVTGGAKGIGEATARKLAALGAAVAIFDVDGSAGRELPPRSRRAEQPAIFSPAMSVPALMSRKPLTPPPESMGTSMYW